MKHWLLILSLAATPALAQSPEAEVEGDMQEGINLLEEGAKLFFKGLMDEMEPALQDLKDGMEPALRDLMDKLDDLDAYHLPEVLPNGDIIIRRKVPLTPEEEEGEVEI
ncbi:hypothetical protein [Actibacterium pelagium]|uniref:AAA+ family ATPase n=1 Tax=Actibacterium pelagium TaxID=2029103 RepID=A0A917AGB1_9RHOB|nr:hypothetical protein [Actibacterium pelagium]GGE49326.1 hypothetical protein GCM10011517_16410 [Actibacterium pelagium]